MLLLPSPVQRLLSQKLRTEQINEAAASSRTLLCRTQSNSRPRCILGMSTRLSTLLLQCSHGHGVLRLRLRETERTASVRPIP